MSDSQLSKSLDKLIDAKYASASEVIKEQLKERSKKIVKNLEKNGLDVTLQLYDKNTKSQSLAQRMNKEPNFL